MTEQLQRIESKLNELDNKLDELRNVVEHRLTKVEGRASIFGVIGIAAAAFVAWLIK